MIKRKNIVTILDIGTTKITCIIVRKNYTNNCEILGISQTTAKGIKSGIIINISDAKDSIIKSIESTEKIVSIKIRKVYVSLNSSFLLSKRSSINSILSNQEVTVKELNKMIFKVLDQLNTQEVKVIHTFPYEYIVEGNRGIVEPLGLYGNTITGFFHTISVPLNYINNITKSLTICKLDIDGYICSGYAAGMACLKTDEIEFGCTLVEISGGSSTISAFFNSKVIYTDGIPYGGINITKDIAKVFNLSIEVAEKIKNTYTANIITKQNNNRVETINIPNNNRSISINDLNEVIIARINEILILLKNKLEDNNMLSLTNKVIFTGGCAEFFNMQNLIQDVFKVKARIGLPNNNKQISINFLKAGLTVPIGMIKCIDDINYYRKDISEQKKSILKSTWLWIKENF